MSQLTAINYLNLFGYIINAFVTFGGAPIFGFPDNAELSEKYQTLVTPAGLTFAIWGIIFISQAIFAIVQMLPRYRSEILVQTGVSNYYFAACIFQSAWTFAFGYESILLSTILMLGILISLVLIVVRQSKLEIEEIDAAEASDKNKYELFWLLKFPFSVHCGWIFAAFAVNFNVFVQNAGADARGQEILSYITLVYAIGIACFALFALSQPDFTIPSVLVWATLGIVLELNEPRESIEDIFEDEVIDRVRSLVLALCIILGIVTSAYGGYRVYKTCSQPSASDFVRA